MTNNEFIVEAYQSLRGRMTAMVGRMLHSSDDAADVIQEAFCRLWPRRETIGSANEAAAIATTTVRNICIDRLRANTRHPAVEVDEERDASPTVGVDRAYEAREQYSIVSRIINERLSDTQRRVMQMKEFDDLSISEIASRLSMDEAAVRMNISRARKTIRELYQEVNK